MTREQLERLLSSSQQQLTSDLDVLDERELELLSILAQGYSGSQIHSQFGIPPFEVKELKGRIQKKLRLKSELDLLRFARKQLQG